MNTSTIFIKSLTTLVLIFGFVSLFGQLHNDYIITHENDTIECEFYASYYLDGQLNGLSVSKKITILKDGEKFRYKPKDIKGFSIYCPVKGHLKFITLQSDKKCFYREAIKGRITLYYIYTRHPDGSSFPMPIAFKNDQFTYLNVMNKKKRIGNLIKDYPNLFNDLMSKKYSPRDHETIFRIYNDYFIKK